MKKEILDERKLNKAKEKMYYGILEYVNFFFIIMITSISLNRKCFIFIKDHFK